MVDGLRLRCSASVLRLVRREALDTDFDFVMLTLEPSEISFFKNSSKLRLAIVNLRLDPSMSPTALTTLATRQVRSGGAGLTNGV
jgi:hypothetical protein